MSRNEEALKKRESTIVKTSLIGILANILLVVGNIKLLHLGVGENHCLASGELVVVVEIALLAQLRGEHHRLVAQGVGKFQFPLKALVVKRLGEAAFKPRIEVYLNALRQ